MYTPRSLNLEEINLFSLPSLININPVTPGANIRNSSNSSSIVTFNMDNETTTKSVSNNRCEGIFCDTDCHLFGRGMLFMYVLYFIN